MATIRIEFETDNAAFDDYDHDAEIVAILEQAKRWLLDNADKARLFDSNGNTVGKVTVE